MIFIEWLKNRLKTDYTPMGLLVRVAVDIFLSNLAFLLGVLFTVFFWVFTWDETPRTFFNKMIIQCWLNNAPLLTFCCLFAYIASGLYHSMQKMTYLNILLLVSRSVSVAFFFFYY